RKSGARARRSICASPRLGRSHHRRTRDWSGQETLVAGRDERAGARASPQTEAYSRPEWDFKSGKIYRVSFEFFWGRLRLTLAAHSRDEAYETGKDHTHTRRLALVGIVTVRAR